MRYPLQYYLERVLRDMGGGFRDRKGTPKNFCDKDFAELSGELSGAICLKTHVLLGFEAVTPSNCSENSLALFVRFFGFGVLFGLMGGYLPLGR